MTISKSQTSYTTAPSYRVEENTILIVLSDYKRVCFETALVNLNGKVYTGRIRVYKGNLNTSCLISFGTGVRGRSPLRAIDIRYFPNYQLQSYIWKTAGLPVYLENVGEKRLFFTTPEGMIDLKPGDRKLVAPENAMPESL